MSEEEGASRSDHPRRPEPTSPQPGPTDAMDKAEIKRKTDAVREAMRKQAKRIAKVKRSRS